MGTGVKPGGSALRAPLWVDAQNVIFDSDGPHSMRGRLTPTALTPFFDSVAGNFDDATGNFDDGGQGTLSFSKPLSVPVTGLLEQLTTANEIFVFIGYLAALYKWGSAAAPEDVSKAGGYTGYDDESITHPATMWSIQPWVDYTVATNGVDAPQYYTGSGDFANLADAVTAFTTAEIFQPLGPHMLAFATGNSKRGFSWCKENDITVWQSATHPSAGAKVIREFNADIKCVKPLGDGLAVYTENQMAIVSYLGTPLYFGALLALGGIGATGKNSVCVVGRLHYGLSRDGIWRTDGATKEYVTDDSFKDWLHDNLNLNQLSKVSAFYNEKFHTVQFSVPMLGSNSVAQEIVLNIESRALMIKSTLYGTVYSDRQNFGHGLQGLVGGNVVEYCRGLTDDGSTMTCYVQTKAMDFGAKNFRKFIDFIIAEVHLQSGSSISFQWAVTETANDTPSFSTAVTVDELAELLPVCSTDRPYLHLKFSSAASVEWTVANFEVHGDVTSMVQ